MSGATMPSNVFEAGPGPGLSLDLRRQEEPVPDPIRPPSPVPAPTVARPLLARPEENLMQVLRRWFASRLKQAPVSEPGFDVG